MSPLLAKMLDVPWLACASPSCLNDNKEEVISVDVDQGSMTDYVSLQTYRVDSKDACLYSTTCSSQVGLDEHYDLKKVVLGTGFSGSVKEAKCRKSGRPVAVKSYRREGMSERSYAAIHAEHDILASLDHPGIVKLDAVYETEDEVCIVTEKLAGGELYDRVLECRGLPEAAAANVTMQLLHALDYLHDQRIVHRDIKPENILYTTIDGSSVKLIDFGFAVKLDYQVDGRRDTAGTHMYGAPEILSGREYDTRSDMWSLGAVVYAMLTSQALYTGSQDSVYKKSSCGNVDFSTLFSRLSKEAQSFVRQLLSVDPLRRPTALQAMDHPWLKRWEPTPQALAGKRRHRWVGSASRGWVLDPEAGPNGNQPSNGAKRLLGSISNRLRRSPSAAKAAGGK